MYIYIYIYTTKNIVFWGHLTHIFGFNSKNMSFTKVIYTADQPLFGLVNTIKHLENIFDLDTL